MSHPHHPVVPSPESCMLLMLPLLDAIIPEASNSQQPKVRQSSLLGLLTFLVLSRLVHVLSMSLSASSLTCLFHVIGCQWQDVGSHVAIGIIGMCHQEILRDHWDLWHVDVHRADATRLRSK